MTPGKIHNQRILISPLNWGYGHVSRCIGLIHQLLEHENTVFIACDADQRKIFEEYFPNVTFIEHEGYPFSFNGKGRFSWDLLFRLSSLSLRMMKERREVEKYVRENNISVVLSDHRYGFRSQSVPGVLITHQYNLPLKWYHGLVGGQHRRLMYRFDEIWIMDDKDSKYAGKLSVSLESSKVHYIGPYSRFQIYQEQPEKDIETTLIASGPDIYAQQLIDQFVNDPEVPVVICSDRLNVPERIQRISGSWKEQDVVIMRSKHVISRSGYSTIMDMHELGIPATYYPTPGQAEQEYLKTIH